MSSSATTAVPSTSPRKAPLLISTPSSSASREATVISPVAIEPSASSISCSLCSGEFVAMYRHGREARLDGRRRDDPNRLRGEPAACSAVRITFELFGRTMTSGGTVASIAATISAAEGSSTARPR